MEEEMTIMEAINRIDALKPNVMPQIEKIKWLNTLDGMIKTKIIDTHEGSVDFSGYDENTRLDTVLLVPSPFDDIYLYWLEAKIDYWSGETARYNNSVAMYNAAYSAYEKYYNRTHVAKGKKFKFF